MKQETLNKLNQSFNGNQIKRRQGNGGNYPYLEAHVIIQRLNESLGGDWSFDILDYKILEREVIVQGKITCLTDTSITKTAFGSSQIKRYEGTDKIISLGDDLKSASSDSLKRAARLLGVGLHLYFKDDPARQQQSRSSGNRQQPQASNGGNGSNGGHSGSNGGGNGSNEISVRQLKYIYRLGRDNDANVQAIAQDSFGRTVEELDKHEASDLIKKLQAA